MRIGELLMTIGSIIFIVFGVWGLNQIFHVENVVWFILWFLVSAFVLEIIWLSIASKLEYIGYRDTFILPIFIFLGAITTYSIQMYVVGKLLGVI